MSYTPLRVAPKFNPQRQTSGMAKKGTNLRDNPQMLNVDYAQNIQNFFINADGQLTKRKGIKLLKDIGVVKPILWLDVYDDNTLIYAYDTIVAAYDLNLGTSTTIKTYSTASGLYSGDRYGGYYFMTNGATLVERFTRTLAYDAQTASFATGLKVTGATSKATATILEDADGGATGTLTLGYISGTFQDNEIITDSSTGSATVNGTLGWASTTVAGSPICKVLKVVAARLYCGNLQDDATAVWYSGTDTGANPPFATWTVGANAADPGKLYFRNAGPINCISEFGQNIVVVFADYGKWAFYTSTIDSGGALKKVDNVVMQKVDGGAEACLFTDEGLFFVNKFGLWKLISLGQIQTPFSEQEENDSLVIGSSYFSDVDLSRASISYNASLRLILVSCAKNSATNNHVICFGLQTQAYSFFKGWAINYMKGNKGIYYAGNANTGKLYQIFTNYDDDGKEIWCKFEQEIKLGGMETRQEIQKMFIQGYLSQSSKVNLYFDIYDKKGVYVPSKWTGLWAPNNANMGVDGFSDASWGVSPWGGDLESSTLSNCLDGTSVRIQNFSRISIRIEENSKLQLIVSWFTLIGRIKAENRRRTIAKIGN